MSIPVVICLAILAVFLVVYPFVHPKIARFLSKWYFWTIFSIIMFAYVLTIYIEYVWVHGILYDKGPDNVIVPTDPQSKSSYYNIFGDATFTAFCGMICFFLPLFLIFNPTRKIAKHLAPVGIVGGLLVLCLYITNKSFSTFPSIFYEYYGSVFRHFILVMLCYMILFNTPPYSFKIKPAPKHSFIHTDAFFTIMVWTIYLVYILFISNLLRIWLPEDRLYYNCGGVYQQDYWPSGQYASFGALAATYPFPPILLWALIYGGTMLFGFIWNCIKKRPKYEHIDPTRYYLVRNPAVYHKWWQW